MNAGQRRPPRIARALLGFLLADRDAEAVVGDLDEEYHSYIAPSRSPLRADLWYWRQVLLSAPLLLLRRLTGFRASGGRLASLWGDVRFALRVLRRRPGFTISAVGTLALGFGMNAAMFSVANAVLLRPLPFEEPGRIVRPLPDDLFFLNSEQAVRLAEEMTTFESMAAWGRTLFVFTSGGEAEEIRGARVSWNHFDILGARPELGRSFDREDATRDDAVLLSHALWMRRFGGDPDLVGTTIEVSGSPMTVIGVMPREHMPIEYDWEAWRPIPLDPALIAGSGLAANARLRDGVTLAEATGELRTVLSRIWEEGGATVEDSDRARMRLVPIRDWLVGDSSQTLTLLQIGVILVLLLASANVGSLLLAQRRERSREFAIRASIGGSRGRLLRQRLIEVGVLYALGGLTGWLAAASSMGWLAPRLPPDLPRASSVAASQEAALFTVLLVAALAVATGLTSALRADDVRGTTSRTPRRSRLRGALVGFEMAIAVVLVIGAGLMLRTMESLRSVDPGFEVERVASARVSPPRARYPDTAELGAYYTQVLAELDRTPGVEAVGAIQFLPMTPGGWWTRYQVLPSDPRAVQPQAGVRVVLGDYFQAMGIELLSGRPLGPEDADPEGRSTAVVNATFAREAFGDVEAVGKRFGMEETEFEVVGVVGDVRQSDLRTGSHAEIYLPWSNSPWRRMHLVMGTGGEPSARLAAARAALVAVDADVPISGPMEMSEIVESTMGQTSFLTTLLTVFGILALGVGAVGVYGVTSQVVAEQSREIGIRIALGARTEAVMYRTLGRGMTAVLIGATLGVVAAITGRRVLEGVVFGIGTADLTTFVVGPAVLLSVAAMAVLVPAIRVSRLDPSQTLREE